MYSCFHSPVLHHLLYGQEGLHPDVNIPMVHYFHHQLQCQQPKATATTFLHWCLSLWSFTRHISQHTSVNRNENGFNAIISHTAILLAYTSTIPTLKESLQVSLLLCPWFKVLRAVMRARPIRARDAVPRQDRVYVCTYMYV